ncbi:hypothetical protein M595_0819 [Lyngbya aestuarii BL J]|uniref:Uncharacterized protein n=1 Tax=Lyngbya aestuarii BL J TaxID=1348334 RepID=U7QMP2_9CYAN|nr:hypothetical protein [Lyngbya aestuarii]ERT09153.1 hypothetical protein M595_0819 [Lyngbya aestuarii BL J]
MNREQIQELILETLKEDLDRDCNLSDQLSDLYDSRTGFADYVDCYLETELELGIVEWKESDISTSGGQIRFRPGGFLSGSGFMGDLYCDIENFDFESATVADFVDYIESKMNT